MWKEFFYYSRNERRGVLIIIAIVVIVLGASAIDYPKRIESSEKQGDSLFQSAYATFMASLEQVKAKKQQSYNKYTPIPKIAPVLQTFDPNQADSAQLVSLGIPSWMAHNILSYRNKSGRFRTPESFRKVYGITEELYATLRPYILIEPIEEKRDSLFLLADLPRDTVKILKYEPGVVLDLNKADTIELKKIPGIGSAIARRIVTYREQLGGYYSITQLSEIHLKDSLLLDWFTIDMADIVSIPINRVGVERLKAHPYLNFYQAKVIVEHRKKRGSLQKMSDLKMYEEFAEADLLRLSYYVNFID